MDDSQDIISINLGTGGFVVCLTGSDFRKIPDYISGTFLRQPDLNNLYAVEGTINSIGPVLMGLQNTNVELKEEDNLPGVFCLPDNSGVGSPYWKADLRMIMSVPGDKLDDTCKKIVIQEGIIFRIAQIIEDICINKLHSKIYLSGGLAWNNFISHGLATILEYPVRLLEEKNTTLVGVAYLALGKYPKRVSSFIDIEPSKKGNYLKGKYSAWKNWVGSVLSNSL